jgi:2,4-dienoyl-CoA reductase-like NADH-dependent reductase (Old Yellow Enzyme family)
LQLAEILELTQTLMTAGDLDYIDLSLWDVNKLPEEEAFKDRSLMAWFMGLDRRSVRVGVAGKVLSAQSARDCLDKGADFVLIGRGAVLHHDYPLQIKANPDFTPIALPVTEAHLLNEGLSPAFVTYMRNWKGFVA